MRALFLARERGTPMKRAPEAVALAERGFEGDRHARQVGGRLR